MTKTILLSVFLIFLTTFNIKGQNSSAEFGIKAGANYAKFTPDLIINGIDFIDYKRKLGFYVGGFVNIAIADDIKIQPELIFAIQGTSVLIEDIEIIDSDGATTFSDYKSNINESTICIPVVLQYSVNDKFYLEGGTQIGYIISRKEVIKKDPLEQFEGINIQNPEFNYDKFDFGFTVGIGYKLSQDITINSRYFLALIERDNNIKSSVFNLGIEYKI